MSHAITFPLKFVIAGDPGCTGYTVELFEFAHKLGVNVVMAREHDGRKFSAEEMIGEWRDEMGGEFWAVLKRLRKRIDRLVQKHEEEKDPWSAEWDLTP